MKRILKKNSKKGFTLLEVMLATAIMTIVSVMIMKGFMSTMNYAHNNNVYNKLGASNYKQALGEITTLVGYGNGDGLQNRINYLKGKPTTTINYNVMKGGAGVKSIQTNAVWFVYDDQTGVNVDKTYMEASVVGNRHSFFYQPTQLKCPNDNDSENHKIRYCEVPANHALDGWYCKQPGCTYTARIWPKTPVPSETPTTTP